MMPVCACVRVLVSHADFSKTTAATDFCKLIVPMNFHALENFFGFMDLGLKISEYSTIFSTSYLYGGR